MSRWFRVDDGLVDDPKVQHLSDELFRAIVNLWCITSQNNGNLPSIEFVAFKLRTTEAKAQRTIDRLRASGLIDDDDAGTRPHNWNGRQFKSDVSTDRVKQFRERRRNVSPSVSETPPETEQKQNITEQIPEAKASGGATSKKSRKRKPETPLPDDWSPTSEDRDYGKSLGLSEKEITRETERFRNGARSKDRTLTNWGMGFRNWLLKAAEFLGREPLTADTATAGSDGFYAAAETAELEAWDDFRQRSEGKSYPRDAKGGWYFPSQWPPETTEAAA
jgi:hypothetical protein